MFDTDYELQDDVCPVCGHNPIHVRDCANLGCEDGWIDRYDEDPLWYDKDHPEMCFECWGTGVERWCPKCGLDLQKPNNRMQSDSATFSPAQGRDHASRHQSGSLARIE